MLTVLFEGSNLNLRTTVTVQTGHTLSVVAPVEILTNVPFPAKGYNFSVNFRFVDKFASCEYRALDFNLSI